MTPNAYFHKWSERAKWNLNERWKILFHINCIFAAERAIVLWHDRSRQRKTGWLIFTVCASKSRTRGQIIHSKKKKKTAEGDRKNGRRDGERAQTGAQGGMSGDKGRSRGIRGSPQSRLPELGWRQLSVEAEKMKHHLGAGPPRCSPSCVQGLWAPLPLKSSTPPLHPAAPSTAPPAIWCLSQHSSALEAVSTLSV